MTYERITGASGALRAHARVGPSILDATHIQRARGSLCGIVTTHEMKADLPLKVTCEICYGMYLSELVQDQVLILEDAQAAFRERFIPESWEYIEREIEDNVG